MTPEKQNALPPTNDPALASASGSTVPFNEANLDRMEKATLTDGIIVECGQDRRVEVWRVKEEEGYAIRIFRPTNDGKTSKLLFGLKPLAAQALCLALSKHLSNDKLTDAAVSDTGKHK